MRLFLLLTLLLCGQWVGATWYVNSPVADMQAGPAPLQEIETQAVYGTPVELLQEKEGWCFVATPDSCRGWLPKSLLTEIEGSYAEGDYAEVMSDSAWVYREPDITRSPPFFALPFPAHLEVISASDVRWIEVRLLSGETAWIQRGDIAINPESWSMEEMLAFAPQLVGLSYRWGGRSSFGFDCSGFVQAMYQKMGISIPRNSRAQAADPNSEDVSLSDLQPGDLCFFSSPSHVGLYLGEGQVLHATPPKIRIDLLTDLERTRKFARAKRYPIATGVACN